MSWGRRPGGGMYGPVKDISAVGISRGLSEDWYSNDSTSTSNRTEIKKGNFWDIIDNPLYEAAAGAAGYDWDTWVNEAKGKVGTGPDDGTTRVRALVKPGTMQYTRYPGGRGRGRGRGRTTPAEYEWMTRDEADAAGYDYDLPKTTRWRNIETGEVTTEGNPYVGRDGSTVGGYNIFARSYIKKAMEEWDEEHEELRDWGVHDEGVAEELDGMSRWLTDIVTVNDHLHPIIREGPKGEHYGIEGDIWEHYGLDQEPEPPRELEWDSYDKRMQLSTTVTSNVGYSTPEGITPVDLHGD